LDMRIDGADDDDAGNFRYSGTIGCKRGLTYDKTLAPAV